MSNRILQNLTFMLIVIIISKNISCRFLESVHEIELIIAKLIDEATTKAVTTEQTLDILQIFVNFQSRTVCFTLS